MSKQAPSTSAPEAPPEVLFTQMLSGYWVSQSLYVAARLGIADLVAGGPRTVEELAAATQTHADTLHRLLRALAGVGVFAEDADGRFALTPLAAYLQTGGNTLRAMAIHMGERASWQAWGELLHTVKTGETAFVHANGQEVFPYYAAHPESAAPFNEAMTNYSALVSEAVVKAYDFSPFRKLVDIGGGHGSLLAAILKANPDVEGVVFDLPPTAEGARERLRAEGLAARCEAVGGDFFASVPAGGDAYVLKTIIHDWDEERALQLLRNIHRAMPDDGKLLLIETVIPPGNEPSFSKLCDLHMAVMTGGRERTEEEYAELFEKAGFKLTRVVQTDGFMGVVEGEKIR